MEAPETELKFETSEGALAALCGHPAFAAPAKTSVLRSVYFDTLACDLKNAGFGLRVREADGGFVQTLKQQKATSPIERSEWEAEVAGERPDLAPLADTPAANVLNGAPDALAPVFVTTVERTQRIWVEGRNVVEVSLDRGEITAGDRREPVHELELELKSGDPAALFDLARALTGCAPLRLSFDSKAERGYRLAAGDGPAPRKAEIGGVSAEMSVADAFRRIGWSCLAQVAANAELLRRRRSIEALHQARVGLRRFRAGLTAFQPMMSGDGFAELRVETKWLAGELDTARDLDVFIQDAFRPAEVATEDRPACAKLGARLLDAQTDAYERALGAVESPRYAGLLLKAAAWLEVGTWTRSDAVALTSLRERRAAEFAGERLDSLRRQVLKRGRKLASLDAPSRHRLRIKAKKLRYAAEFFAECFGDRVAKKRGRFLRSLGDLQDRLGQLNDIGVARRVATGLVQDQPSDLAFAAGLIVGGRQGAAATIDQAALQAFAAFEDAKPFWH